jgi:hypothetical protein
MKRHERVLALHLNRRGLGFCVFDAPGSLHDWGMKQVPLHDRHAATLTVVERLLDRFQPEVVVIEDVHAVGASRSNRVATLYGDIESLVEDRVIEVRLYPWEAVFRAFATIKPNSRHDIAVHVTQLLPMLRRRLPPKRKAWLPIDPRQSLFDAASLGITYYSVHSRGN